MENDNENNIHEELVKEDGTHVDDEHKDIQLNENDDNKGNEHDSNHSSDSDDSQDNPALEDLMIKSDTQLKYGTIISTICCIISIGVSMICSILKKQILTFDFKDARKKDILTMNQIAISVYLLILVLFNCCLLYCAFISKKQDQMLFKMIYSNLRWFFVLTQICFAGLFLIGIIWSKSNWTYILSVSINMTTTLLIAFYFQDIKKKKNMTIGSFVCVYCYLSVLFAFISYATFYNFSCILIENLIENNPNNNSNTDYQTIIQIVTNFFQMLLGLVLLTYFKDVLFALGSVFIFLGLLINVRFSLEKAGTSVVVYLCILGFSSIIVVGKNGKSTFGYENVKVLDSENI